MARGAWIGTIGIAAVLAIAAGAVGIAATAQAGSTPQATASAAATYDLGVLGSAATAADALPSGFDPASAVQGGLDRASIRLLQSGTAGTFWAALDARGRLCLIAAIGPASAVHGAACTTADRFHEHALTLRVASGGAAAEAHLVPDAVSVKVLRAVLPEAATISGYGNLVLVAPGASAASRAALTRATAPVYDLGVPAA
ncbi:hypothetical protein [Leifsonia sp. NPDC080035]|uniref:Uncharacterized protein n=1 Tax=Leifsonia sp. NPDC080035 TaxID=3143936 RepID=A0AAU7GDY6_9MICO